MDGGGPLSHALGRGRGPHSLRRAHALGLDWHLSPVHGDDGRGPWWWDVPPELVVGVEGEGRRVYLLPSISCVSNEVPGTESGNRPTAAPGLSPWHIGARARERTVNLLLTGSWSEDEGS